MVFVTEAKVVARARTASQHAERMRRSDATRAPDFQPEFRDEFFDDDGGMRRGNGYVDLAKAPPKWPGHFAARIDLQIRHRCI